MKITLLIGVLTLALTTQAHSAITNQGGCGGASKEGNFQLEGYIKTLVYTGDSIQVELQSGMTVTALPTSAAEILYLNLKNVQSAGQKLIMGFSGTAYDRRCRSTTPIYRDFVTNALNYAVGPAL